jgi:hypothetical protein
VRYDPKVYDAANARARRILAAADPIELLPEGKLAGGSECRWCAWAGQCTDVTVASIPQPAAGLGANAAAELKGLRDAERKLAASLDASATSQRAAQEAIKQFLRLHNVRGHKGDDWSVQWSSVKGRQSLDAAGLLAAAEAAGIRTEQYQKEGRAAERLTVT